MSVLKFGQVEIAARDFNKARQLTELDTINLDNIVLSEPVSAKYLKDEQNYIGYQTPDGGIIPLLIKTPKDTFSTGVSQYETTGFSLTEHVEWIANYELMWNVVEQLLFHSLTKEPLNNGYLNAKLKKYNEHVTTDFKDCDIPYSQYCRATAVLKITSVYHTGSRYYPQVYLEECKHKEIEPRNHSCLLSDSEDEWE